MSEWPFELPSKKRGEFSGTSFSKFVGLSKINTSSGQMEDEALAEFLKGSPALLKTLGKSLSEASVEWVNDHGMPSNVNTSSLSIGSCIAGDNVSLKNVQFEFDFDVSDNPHEIWDDLEDELRFGFEITLEISTKDGYVEFVFNDFEDNNVELVDD